MCVRGSVRGSVCVESVRCECKVGSVRGVCVWGV